MVWMELIGHKRIRHEFIELSSIQIEILILKEHTTERKKSEAIFKNEKHQKTLFVRRKKKKKRQTFTSFYGEILPHIICAVAVLFHFN